MKRKWLFVVIVGVCLSGLFACGEPPHEHKFDFYTYNNDATCISDGTETAVCAGCGATDTRVKAGSLNPNAHKFVDGFCEYCSKFDYNAPETTCLEYEDNGDGTCSVVGCTDKRIKYVKIPEKHDGKSVTEIERDAFSISDIKYAVLPSGIIDIGIGAFGHCEDLIEIDVPQGVTSIEFQTFSYCRSLKTVTLPDGIISIHAESFSGCDALTDINMPSGLTEIGERAFLGCSSLSVELALPDGVVNIGEYAFYGCASLRGELVVPDGVVGIGKSAFEDCASLTAVTLPDGLAQIAENAFSGCTALSSVNIPDGVQTVGLYAFMNSGLKNLFIPKSVSFIYPDAFRGCGKLESITVDKENQVYESVDDCLIQKRNKWLLLGCKNSVIPTDGRATSIEMYAFCDIAELTSVEIPSSIEYIFGTSFYGCDNITSLTVAEGHSRYASIGNCVINKQNNTLVLGCKNSVIPDDGRVTAIGERAFEGSGMTELVLPRCVAEIGKYAYADCKNLTAVDVSGDITEIGAHAFDGCSGLTEATVDAKILGDRIFANCENLRRVTIGDSSESVGGGMFYMCLTLEEVVLGASVNSIGGGAFSECRALMSLTIPASVQTVGSTLFGNTNITVYCEAAHKPDGWKFDWNSGKAVVWDCKNNDKDENGYAYVTVSDVVYAVKDGTASVVACSANAVGKIVVPQSVQYGGDDYSVTDIAKYAFYCCEGVTELRLPNSLSSIGEYAFFVCENMQTVIFDGDISSWQAIEKREFWRGFFYGTRYVRCIDGTIEL